MRGTPGRKCGTRSAYVGGCKCTECMEANRVWQIVRRVVRRKMLTIDATSATHGIKSTYSNWGCRCGKCVEANRQACREYRSKVAQRTADKWVVR